MKFPTDETKKISAVLTGQSTENTLRVLVYWLKTWETDCMDTAAFRKETAQERHSRSILFTTKWIKVKKKIYFYGLFSYRDLIHWTCLDMALITRCILRIH